MIRLMVSMLAVAMTAAAPSVTLAQATPAQRSTELNRLLHEYHEYSLKVSPETATRLGDTRYNDSWSDYSAAAFNTRLQRENEFIARLGAIDTAGLAQQEQAAAKQLMGDLVTDEESASLKPWQRPITQNSGPQKVILLTVAKMPFTTAADYDNYIARLNKIPAVFSQVQQAMDAGIDDGHTVPRAVATEAQQQIAAIAQQSPADSPFAAPLARMPASISPAEQKRIRTEATEAITLRVLPAYDHFSRYLKAQYIPKTRTS